MTLTPDPSSTSHFCRPVGSRSSILSRHWQNRVAACTSVPARRAVARHSAPAPPPVSGPQLPHPISFPQSKYPRAVSVIPRNVLRLFPSFPFLPRLRHIFHSRSAGGQSVRAPLHPPVAPLSNRVKHPLLLGSSPFPGFEPSQPALVAMPVRRTTPHEISLQLPQRGSGAGKAGPDANSSRYP